MLELLFPKECLMCSKTGSWLCQKCEKKLVQTLPNCHICKTLSNKYQTHHLCLRDNTPEKVTTIWKYNEHGKKLIHNYKYKHRFKVGDFIFSLFETKLDALELNHSVIIPIPSHTNKKLERGFNPTEIIAELIAQRYNIPINNQLLTKRQNNQSQASQTYDLREDNVKNAFEINEREIPRIKNYKEILLLDDIITTGATIKEISKILRVQIPTDIKIKALCIFQGNFKKHESQKRIQSNKK